MIQKSNLYAVVVWYHPTPEQCASIRTYMDAVAHVVIVDNSPENNLSLAQTLPRDLITYLPLKENKGIATALNIGCRTAIEHGAQWVMTMDQDSRWEAAQLQRYIELVNAYPQLAQTGVFSPRQNYSDHVRRYAQTYEQKIAVMTSGCLLAASGYEAVGGFRDELFIDEVDNEYCMHIRSIGMQVVVVNDAILEHRLGELRTIRFLGIWRKEYIAHEPFRFYYITRNILRVSDLYPEYRRFNSKRLQKHIKRIILYDHRHKFAALRMCWRGWRDYRKGQFGKLC